MLQASILAGGNEFSFWEKEINFTNVLYVAQPGTHILIGPGEYHECVSPERGGDGPDSMICICQTNVRW